MPLLCYVLDIYLEKYSGFCSWLVNFREMLLKLILQRNEVVPCTWSNDNSFW